MKILATAVACCVVLALAGPSFAAEKNAKDNKTKIVGVWEVTKSDNAPPGATVEFTKDGKMIVTIKDGDKTIKVEGTYTIEKDSITSNLKVDDKEMKETVTITKLTDKELVVKDAKGKVDEFKKK
ncbi:MAG TPA: TIGR03066 family protein [Gemmataceae bacterium]|nr:TIGR03066 family protein [Gemmataceae bacterium]